MIRQQQRERPGLPVEVACQLLGVSRGSFYYQGEEFDHQAFWDELLREQLEPIVLELPGYGYRRATKELHRQGWHVNHKRVLRVMREAGLLCRRRRRSVRTTNSAHGLRVWPNLLPEVKPTGLDQVWVADLTYIRLPGGFCYLAAILDAYSRKVIGWELSEHIDAELALTALDQALLVRQPAPGFVHHSDQGVQYASALYVERLLSAGARISMSRRGHPRDNAQAESFFRTLKCEEVYLQDYQDIDEAEANLARFIDDVYNQKRLHSSLGYVPPSEFEANHAKSPKRP